MCMWFGYNPQIILTLFCNLNLVVFGYFDNESEWTVGTLCAQLLQFHFDSFEILQMSLPYLVSVHVVRI